MSSPSTKETLRGLDKAEFLGTSTRTQLPTVTPLLGEVFSVLPPRGEGEDPRQLSWNEVQIHNAELIDHGKEEVQQSSQAHKEAKIAVFDFARDRRDGTTGLQQRHRSLQKIIEGTYGPRILAFIGLNVPPVTTMLGLREQEILIFKQMVSPALSAKLATIPRAEIKGSPLNFGFLSEQLQADIETFETAQANWTQARKVRDEAYVAKKKAESRLRRIVTNVARIQEGYYRLAGLDELADRLRLTIRSFKRRPVVSPTEPPASEPPIPEPSTDVPVAATEANEF